MLANHGVGTRVGSGSGGGHHLRFRNTTLRMGEEGEEKVIGMCCEEIARKLGCESGVRHVSIVVMKKRLHAIATWY